MLKGQHGLRPQQWLNMLVCQVLQHSLHDGDAAYGTLEWSSAVHHAAAVRSSKCCHYLHVSAAAISVAGWYCCTLHVVTKLTGLCGMLILQFCQRRKTMLDVSAQRTAYDSTKIVA